MMLQICMPKEMMRALLPFYVKYVKNIYCPIGAKDLFNVEYWQHIQTEGIFLYIR